MIFLLMVLFHPFILLILQFLPDFILPFLFEPDEPEGFRAMATSQSRQPALN